MRTATAAIAILAAATVAGATLLVADLTPVATVYGYPTPTRQHRLQMAATCPENLWIIEGECKAADGSDCDAACVVRNGTTKSIRP